MICDFHTHTTLSDGDLSPVEMVRRALVSNYSAIALTDHAATGDMERILNETSEVCALARKYWNILAIPGIELTHVPAEAINEVAKKAKESGAWLVVVHGETIVEPVEKGTNLAALNSPYVDILAHPGLLTLEEARLAARKHIYLEISARKGHALTNGLVASLAQKAGAKLLLDSDAHGTKDLLTEPFAVAVLQGAGIAEASCNEILKVNTAKLLKKLARHQA